MSQKALVTLRRPQDAEIVRASGCEILYEYPNSMLVRCSEEQQGALEEAGLEVTLLAQQPVEIPGASFAFASALEADVAAPVTLDPNRRGYFLVQAAGPVSGPWLETVRSLGGQVHNTLPGDVLLVGMLPAQTQQLQQAPWVEGVTPWRAAMKVSPRLRPGVSRNLGTAELATLEVAADDAAQQQVEITVFPGESTAMVAAQVRDSGGTVLSESPNAVAAIVPAASVVALANDPGVQAILPHQFPRLHNDRARPVLGVPAGGAFGGVALQGTGEIVAVADSGLDTGNPVTAHQDIRGRIVNITSWPNQLASLANDPAPFDDGPADTNSGHGTHVSGSVLGNGTAALAAGAANPPAGVAPEARLFFQAIEQRVNWKTAAQLIAAGIGVPPGWPPQPVGLYGLPANLADLFDQAYAAGARIHTNSWGAVATSLRGVYNADAGEVDAFMWNHRDMLILFSASNEGEDSNSDGFIDQDSVMPPGTAKNCVTVGASENDRPAGSLPTPGIDADWDQLGPAPGMLLWPALGAAGHVSDNVDGMAAFSSRGPTDDGRIKPDVVAPGTNILSVRSSLAGPNPLWGDLNVGDPLRGLYCWSGGTSMSTPLVAGAAAVVRQYLIQERGHFQAGLKPSGALVKAFLVHGAVPLAGQYPGEVPAGANEVAGFGRVNLTESLFGGAPQEPLFSDEPDLAVETGEIRTFVVQAADPGQPLKATLVWTDAPGLPNAGTLQNRLYLRVRDQTGAIVEGDVTPFPAVANNVQQVVIPAPAAGPYEIQVYGVAVTLQAPGATGGPNPRQDFALVVSNAAGTALEPPDLSPASGAAGSMDLAAGESALDAEATRTVRFVRSW